MKNLNELTLPELESLYNLIDKGVVDGLSTKNIEVEAQGYQYGHEKWKKSFKRRKDILNKIKKTIKTKVDEIEL